jgi:hypothetical protein
MGRVIAILRGMASALGIDGERSSPPACETGSTRDDCGLAQLRCILYMTATL